MVGRCVTNSYNDRLVWISADGNILKTLSQITLSSGEQIPISNPRALAVHEAGLFISDDRSLVHIVTEEGISLGTIGPDVRGAGGPYFLGNPRDIALLDRNTIVMSDYENSRALVARLHWA